jgi:hypothetical protein
MDFSTKCSTFLNDLVSGLDRMHFQHIINVPNPLFEQYQRSQLMKQPLHDDHAYFLFKGKKCNEIGAQVLIDDMEAVGLSHRGCEVHGIIHLHPDDL